MEILQLVIEFLQARNVEAYLVGGWVRDRVLNRQDNRDIDIALKGDAIELARAFANMHHGAFYLMDEEHRVARALFTQTYVDFAELRGEVTADLASRDFTVNAMALPISAKGLADVSPGELASFLTDPFHGWADVQARLIRAVSDDVFRRDPVRLLRAPRLAGSLGFVVEPDTVELMRRDAGLLALASMERARDELFKILARQDVSALLGRMDEWGLLGALLPEVTALKGVVQRPPHIYDVFEHTLQTVSEIVQIQANGYADIADGAFAQELHSHFDKTVSGEHIRGTLLRLIGLLHDVAKPATQSVDSDGLVHFYGHEALGAEMAEPILRRLRLSNAEMAIAGRTIRMHLRPEQLACERQIGNRAIYRFFREAQDAGVDVCLLALADTRAKAGRLANLAEENRLSSIQSRLLSAYYRSPEKAVSPPRLIDGRTLMEELRLPAGPLVGKLLERIREAQAEGQVSSRQEALALAREMLHNDKK